MLVGGVAGKRGRWCGRLGVAGVGEREKNLAGDPQMIDRLIEFTQSRGESLDSGACLFDLPAGAASRACAVATKPMCLSSRAIEFLTGALTAHAAGRAVLAWRSTW